MPLKTRKDRPAMEHLPALILLALSLGLHAAVVKRIKAVL